MPQPKEMLAGAVGALTQSFLSRQGQYESPDVVGVHITGRLHLGEALVEVLRCIANHIDALATTVRRRGLWRCDEAMTLQMRYLS